MEDIEKLPSVTIAKFQDRIPTELSAERAAEIHGVGAVFVDGKPYAEILAAQAPAEEPAEEPAQEPAQTGGENA
jgi:hypothetical protein